MCTEFVMYKVRQNNLLIFIAVLGEAGETESCGNKPIMVFDKVKREVFYCFVPFQSLVCLVSPLAVAGVVEYIESFC